MAFEYLRALHLHFSDKAPNLAQYYGYARVRHEFGDLTNPSPRFCANNIRKQHTLTDKIVNIDGKRQRVVRRVS